MTDPRDHDRWPNERDFPSIEDWERSFAAPIPEGSVDPQFVEDVLASVRAAARPGANDLPRAVLDSYRVREPSADFVARTLRHVRSSHSTTLHGLLGAHRVPEPSKDFVERTLSALGIAQARPRVARRRPVQLFRAAAVLVVAIGVGLLARPLFESTTPQWAQLATLAPAADELSPAPWATALVRADARSPKQAFRLVDSDPLLFSTLSDSAD